jgi:hypothetical protein
MSKYRISAWMTSPSTANKDPTRIAIWSAHFRACSSLLIDSIEVVLARFIFMALGHRLPRLERAIRAPVKNMRHGSRSACEPDHRRIRKFTISCEQDREPTSRARSRAPSREFMEWCSRAPLFGRAIQDHSLEGREHGRTIP